MGPKSNSKASKGNKQNGNKSNGGKLQTQDTRADKDPTGEANTDYSMLRKPIDININGVGQVLKVYQSGTTEVRNLLQYECNLVYECKVCTNLFRSLANFISHKRVYCRELYSDTKRVFPTNHLLEDSTTVIQPEPAIFNPRKETWITSDVTPSPGKNDEPIPRIETSVPRIASYTNPKKDLSQIVEKLAQKKGLKTVTETIAHISASKFYESVSDQLKTQKDAHKEHVIRLEAMENTRYGVFQTVLQSSSTVQMENTDLMKAQVVELHNMMSCNEATLGPDGQVSVMNGEGTADAASSGGKVKKQGSPASSKSVSPKENHVCTICNTRFSTRKTLSHHMKSLHVTFRLCYPCPCCKNTFCNTWSVYRHLYKVHRKTTLQVRKLRSQIVNKAFKKEVSDEGQSSGSKSHVPVQTEADKARKEQQRLHQENQAWMNNLEDDLELQMCGGCGRRFERRAALNSHSQICQKRIAVQNNIKAKRTSPSISTTATGSRVTNIKISVPSTDRQNLSEHSKNDSTYAENNGNRLTPVSVQSESGIKCMVTPSPSPVSIDQFLSSSPGASLHRTRHCSGSSVIAKKDVPEKRIEIQIRRDYCKTGTGSTTGSVGHQQDCNSESNENLFDGGNEDDTSSFHEDGKIYQSRELGTATTRKDNDTPTLTVCRYPGRRAEFQLKPETFDECVNDNDDDFDDASSICSMPDNDVEERSSNQSDRSSDSGRQRDSVSVERGTSNNSEMADELSPSSEQDDLNSTPEDQTPQSTPVTGMTTEEQIAVMESRMQNIINVKRLQCLPCQKKFNKYTNLRRHAAVHIGWNRYRCTECTFRCFSKYDCVAHANKIHLETPDHNKAQTMVQVIEFQIEDSENEPHNEENSIENESPDLNEVNDESEDKNILDWPVLENSEIVDHKSSPKVQVKEEIEEEQGEGEEETSITAAELSEEKHKEVITRLSTVKSNDRESEATVVQGAIRIKQGRGRPRKRRASFGGVSRVKSEAIPSKKLITAVECQETIKDEGIIETEEKPKISEMEAEITDNEAAEGSESPEESPSKSPQDLQQQTALRKMVLQVIFGAGNSAVSQETETPETMFPIEMNGEVAHTGSTSSPEPYEVVEAVSSNCTSPLSSPSTTSPLSASEEAVDVPEQAMQGKDDSKYIKHGKIRNSVTPTFEIERRQRPVRNRIKVEREDFIYDLSDRCLDPKRDTEDRNKITKRKQESVKVFVDKGNCSGEAPVNLLPKLMLVRTNKGEYSGVKVVKSSSSSNVSQVLENSGEKNSVGYNISTRKSQRTFDISPHKNSKQQ